MAVRHRVKAAAALLVLTLVLALLFGRNAAMALFDQGKAVQIDPSSIEDSTLIIGTHLIYLHSLNEGIYGIAVQSASDSGQDRRYYKSELAGGIWMDITDAGSISDITAGGTVADESEIAHLYLTHHTKSDGITYDLRTNQAVCIYDIIDVYDLEKLPELEALKLQYDKLRESRSGTKTDKRNISLIRDFFAAEYYTDDSLLYDWQLGVLQGYYEELAANGADSKYLETVLAVMEKVSNARKVQVFASIGDALGKLQDDVAEADGDDVQIDDALLTSIGDSQYALEESRAEAEGDMLDARQDSVVAEKEYRLCMDMISNAENSNYFGCDEQNLQLQLLGNINNGRIVNAAEELKLLETLTDSAELRYGAELSAGMTPEYQVLVSQNVSHAARENRMNTDVAGASAARGELEFLVQGTVDRMESIGELAGAGTQAYILQKIQETAKYKTAVRQDDYAEKYQGSVTEYIQWLNSLLASIKSTGGGQGEGQTLYEQKEDLREQKLKALDSLDLDAAKRIDAKIAELDEQISALETTQSKKLEELTARKSELEAKAAQNPQDISLQMEISGLEAQLAEGQAALSGSSQAANIMESKNEILKLLADGDTSKTAMARLADNVDLLAAMLEEGSPLALAAMKEVYGKMLAKSELEDVSAYDTLREGIEAAVSESAVSAKLTDELSPERACDIVADALGIPGLLAADGSIAAESLAAASAEDLQAALLALGGFNDETGADDSMRALVQGLAAALEQEPGAAVFQTYQQQNEAYVPVETLGNYLGYRYVWNATRKCAVLSQGRIFFSFTAYDDQVGTGKDEPLTMEQPAVFSRQLLIPGSFVQKQFGCHVYGISGTDYSVLVNDRVVDRSQDILSELLKNY